MKKREKEIGKKEKESAIRKTEFERKIVKESRKI